MTSITKKGLLLAASLLSLAGSPALAAKQHLHREARINGLSTPTYTRELPPSLPRSDNSDHYNTLWVKIIRDRPAW
jgi:hypothetical protein